MAMIPDTLRVFLYRQRLGIGICVVIVGILAAVLVARSVNRSSNEIMLNVTIARITSKTGCEIAYDIDTWLASGNLHRFHDPPGGIYTPERQSAVERNLFRQNRRSQWFDFPNAEPDSIELFVKPGDKLRLGRGENVPLFEYVAEERGGEELNGERRLVRHRVMVRFD
jgi:hypothetical protein